MVVCKFFQQGNCRYGQSCRFEHIYGSKYSYNAGHSSPAQPQAATSVTDEQLVNQVQSDIQAALRGGQWLLSEYAPFKEKPALPGLQNLSFEEARLFVYEAKAGNNLEQAVAYMNNLFQEARRKHEQLIQPNPTIINTLRSLYKGETVTSPFNNVLNSAPLSSSTPASSVFRSAVQNSVFGQGNASPGFGQSPSIFNTQNTSNDKAKSIFAQAAQSQSSNVFGNPQTNQNVFANNQMNHVFGTTNPTSQGVFAQSPSNGTADTAKSIFAQANQSITSPSQTPASLFAAANQTSFVQPSPFQTNNAFQSAPSVFQTSDPFGGTKNVFQQPITDDEKAYSLLEELSQEDMEAFQSDSFQLGFVPEVPPPRGLCV